MKARNTDERAIEGAEASTRGRSRVGRGELQTRRERAQRLVFKILEAKLGVENFRDVAYAVLHPQVVKPIIREGRPASRARVVETATSVAAGNRRFIGGEGGRVRAREAKAVTTLRVFQKKSTRRPRARSTRGGAESFQVAATFLLLFFPRHKPAPFSGIFVFCREQFRASTFFFQRQFVEGTHFPRVERNIRSRRKSRLRVLLPPDSVTAREVRKKKLKNNNNNHSRGCARARPRARTCAGSSSTRA